MQNACVWNDCLRAVLETLSPRDERVTAQALGIGDKERIYLNFSPAGTQPTDVILAMTAIQGLINRSGPFILFDSTAYPGTWGGTPRVLADYVARRLECAMEKRSGESAEENLRLLLRLTAGALRGATVYDPANVHNYALAANIAAITFTVPLSRRLFVMLQEENALEEVYTLTASSGSESEIYGFIAQELVPYLDTTCFYNFATKGDVANGDCLPGTDYAFYRKGILYDIDKGENYTRLMRLAGPNALEFGWNYCGEAKSSCFGIGQFASVQGTTNLSFFAAMPSELKRPWKENCKPSVDTPARKLYLAFVSNEGDTGGVLTTQFKGAWNSPNRGRFYQNWAINPNAARLFPALLEFYVSTKTDKDHFICAPSGAAYVHGDLMSPEALGRFIDFTADILSKDCSLREAGVWACSDMAVQYRLLRELDLDMVVPKPEGLLQIIIVSATVKKS